MAKTNKGVKAINTEKMIPEKDALDGLKYFCTMVVFGNKKARMRLLKTIDKCAAKDGRNADQIADYVMALVVQNDENLNLYAQELADNEAAMEKLNAAKEIREILNLNAYDDVCKKMHDIELMVWN